MDKVTKICNNKLRQRKLKIGYWNLQPVYVQALIYADDVVLMAETEEKLQEIVTTWTNNLKSMNLTMNAEKCKILQITRKKEEEIIKPKIKVEEIELENVEQFNYLGTVFSGNGKIGQEIKNRIAPTTRTYYQINQTIINKKEIQQKTKMQIYHSEFLPTLMYGCESWAKTKKIESQVTAMEMRYLRRVINKTRWDRERNEKIRKDLNVTPIVEKIEEKQLKWFGHVKRMGPERIVKRCVEAREWEKRSRGRPRSTWLNTVEQYGQRRGKTTKEMEIMVKDRKVWKAFSEATRR